MMLLLLPFIMAFDLDVAVARTVAMFLLLLLELQSRSTNSPICCNNGLNDSVNCLCFYEYYPSNKLKWKTSLNGLLLLLLGTLDFGVDDAAVWWLLLYQCALGGQIRTKLAKLNGYLLVIEVICSK